MDFRIDIDNKNQIVICACEGMLDLASAKLMTRDVRKRAFELGYGLLYDVTNVSLDVGITEAYFFPRDRLNIYEDVAHRRGKVAIVCKFDKDFWKFFETTARNAGVDVTLFWESKEAIEWLSIERAS